MIATPPRVLASLCLALLLSPAVGRAQAAPAPAAASAKASASPKEVVLSTIEMTKKGDWAGFAQAMHPAALAELRKLFRPLVEVGAAQIGQPFFGVASVKEFDALSDTAVFEKLMSSLSQLPGFAEAMSSAEASVIGTLEEGPDLAHVVYRTSAQTEGITISKTAVATLRRSNGEWKALLSGSIEGMAQRLAAVVGAGGGEPED